MVSLDCVDNILVFTVLCCNFNTELNVRAVNLSSHSLTNIVEKTCSASLVNVNAHFLGNNACKHGNLNRMTKSILTVRGTVLHSTEKLNKLGMQAVNTCLEDSLLTGLLNSKVNVTASLLNHLLNSCGMDTAVADKLFKSNSGNFTSYGVKAGNGDNVGSIVNDKLNACKILDSTDISTLTTDNSTLHLVTGNFNNGNSDFTYVVSSKALNCKRKDVLCLAVCLVSELLFILGNLKRSFMLHFGIKTSNELCLCLLAGKTCDFLKHSKLSL